MNLLIPPTPGLPGNIMGVDIYHGDNVQDGFNAARQFGLYFVIHKATQGVGPRAHDPLYAVRREKWMAQPALMWTNDDGSQVSIPPLWGAYDFNTGDPVKDQVINFLNIAAPDDRTALILDYEDNRASPMTLAQAIEWGQRVANATGQLPKLYSGNRIKEDIVRATSQQREQIFELFPDFWLCQYGSHAVLRDSNSHPLPWDMFWMWQRDADGAGPDHVKTIPGIQPAGRVDENVYVGTPVELMQSWVKRVPA